MSEYQKPYSEQAREAHERIFGGNVPAETEKQRYKFMCSGCSYKCTMITSEHIEDYDIHFCAIVAVYSPDWKGEEWIKNQ